MPTQAAEKVFSRSQETTERIASHPISCGRELLSNHPTLDHRRPSSFSGDLLPSTNGPLKRLNWTSSSHKTCRTIILTKEIRDCKASRQNAHHHRATEETNTTASLPRVAAVHYHRSSHGCCSFHLSACSILFTDHVRTSVHVKPVTHACLFLTVPKSCLSFLLLIPSPD
ncbi:hypothetical protein L1887_38631 [Cichorium endivia]|nr:hypothetical protein L1887_38631 [Cichorium endivia]